MSKRKENRDPEKGNPPPTHTTRLYNSELSGRDIERVNIWGQPSEGLLCSIGPSSTSACTSGQSSREVRTNLIKVLTLIQSTSYSFLIASLICLLFALMSTMKTRVLFSSIFFIADSVLSGWTMTLNWSSRGTWGTLLRGYFPLRASERVLGRWKVVERRTLRVILEWSPFRADFFASVAFLLAGLLPRFFWGLC